MFDIEHYRIAGIFCFFCSENVTNEKLTNGNLNKGTWRVWENSKTELKRTKNVFTRKNETLNQRNIPAIRYDKLT